MEVFEDRFWKKVDKKGVNDCWPWIGYISSDPRGGYGRFFLKGRAQLAHRISFSVSGKKTTFEKPQVLHICDNRCCVNPYHLYAGSHQDNMSDKSRRGRVRHGEYNYGGSKLSINDVVEIRNLCGKLTEERIGKKYGISTGAVSLIRNHKTWKQI
jgi:hypothetical protein